MFLKKLNITLLWLFIGGVIYSQEYNFWQYNTQSGLADSKINCLLQDNNGYLWVGTQLGLSKFDGNTFVTYDRFDNLSNNPITHLLQDSLNKIWIGHENGDISLYDNSKFESIITNNDSIVCFTKSINNELIVVGKKEIFEIINGTKKKLPFLLENKQEIFVSCSQLNTKKWVVVTNKKIIEYQLTSNLVDIKDSLVTTITSSFFIQLLDSNYALISEKGEVLIVNKNFKKLFVSRFDYDINSIFNKGNKIFLSTNKGLVKLNYEGKKIVVEDKVSEQNGLIENNITGSLIDRNNSLWIGTLDKGVCVLPQARFPLIKQKGIGNLVSYLYQGINNYIFTYDNAIVSKTYSGLNFKSNIIYRTNTKQLTCAVRTKNGEIWGGTNKGLFLKFSNSALEYNFKEFANQSINDLKLLKNGNVLIATNKGVYKYSNTTNRVVSYFPKGDMEGFIIKRFVSFKDVFYGLGNGNIIKFKEQDVAFLFNKDDDEVKQLDFSGLFKDEKGILWISSLGKGVFKYVSKNNYELLTKTIQFPYKYINSFCITDTLMWLTTKQGLAKININTGNNQFYGTKYLNNINFNILNPIIINGKIYFSAKEGIVSVTPSFFNKNSFNELVINSFKVLGRDVLFQEELVFDYGNYPIKIDYESIHFLEKRYYQSKLEGFNEDWSDPTTQSSTFFSNLSPGKYVFKVRLVDPKNNIVGTEKSISFQIKIPFWKTTQFLIIVVLSIILLFFIIYFFRIITLRRQKKRLEIEVERKTFQISRQKKYLEQFSYSLSHDLKNPINNIKGLVEILEDNKSDEVLKMLSESTVVLEKKIVSTLKSIQKAQSNTKNITNVSFLAVFENVKKSLLLIIKESKAEIKTNFKIDSIEYEESIIESILYNLISNSIKYKHPDRVPLIEINTSTENGLVHISLKDNGLGIDLEKEKQNMFSIFKRVHKDAEGTGLGLYMIKQMIEINEGSIDLESQPNIGTTFHIYLKRQKIEIKR